MTVTEIRAARLRRRRNLHTKGITTWVWSTWVWYLANDPQRWGASAYKAASRQRRSDATFTIALRRNV